MITDKETIKELGAEAQIKKMTNPAEKITRQDFFKDKGLLFNLFSLEVISMYLFFIHINESLIFLVPTSLFGFLGLLELWFITKKNKGEKLTK